MSGQVRAFEAQLGDWGIVCSVLDSTAATASSGGNTGLTLETDSVCSGWLRVNSKVNSWQRVTVEIKERGSMEGYGSGVTAPLVHAGLSPRSEVCAPSAIAAITAAPLVRVKVKFTVKNSISCRGRFSQTANLAVN